MGLFDSITELAKDVTRVVIAPVEIAATVADAAVKPVAEGLEEVVKDTKELLK